VEAGARLTGASVYELPAGEALWPYHYELQREEWLVVVAGEAVVRTPEGEWRARAGDVVCFPLGAAGAHALRNETNAPVRLLFLSNVVPRSYSAVQPDSDKLLVHDGDRRRIVRASPELDYWEGEA
jgi:uncharacterized cupin superfamily protein